MSATKVTVERNVAARMRDGTSLRSDIYLPRGPGPFPTLVCRTPYDKQRDIHIDTAEGFADRGYLVVVQDVRGRYASDGEFRPGFYSAGHSDPEDGYDTVEWAAQLPWSDGKVGTFGNSYCGWTQWELAHTRPPHLVAMLPQGIAANLLDRELSGVLRLGRVLWWTINTLAPDERRRAGNISGPRDTAEAERLWIERDRSKWLWHLPLMDIPDEVMFGMGRHFRGWLADHTTDYFGFLDRHRQVEVPALSTTGWYDQQIGTIKQFTGMREYGMTARAREHQHLIIGPWSHTSTDWHHNIGDVDFGPAARRDYHEVADQWFRYWLRDEPNEVAQWPPIRLFVMGANQWRDETEWPLARTVYTEFFLHSDGAANSAAGDGTLSQTLPQDEPPDEYVYDPRDPVMTIYTPAGQHEPQDQRSLDGRPDVLVFRTPPLVEALEVTGPITATLWAASSAGDTDFVVKVMDRWPDGFSQELCHGIVRARYRESLTHPSLIEPGRAYEYTIVVNPTSNLFRPGHCLEVHVSSSDFPNFDRNHNTGGNDYAESSLVTARQTVFHDYSRPSRVILPIIPSS
ncbi:MAG: hypothetical protein CL878_11460 [Dehalococcoidia bacterium]|nr:hypothetical protein [Dehalococcoidia bacterium]